MNSTTLIGIDLGKHTFHLHCQDKNGKALYRKKMTRTKLLEFLNVTPCATVVMAACAGAHFMARKIAALGHETKLISPQFVRPFVKSNKNDFIDAETIYEGTVANKVVSLNQLRLKIVIDQIRYSLDVLRLKDDHNKIFRLALCVMPASLQSL